MNTDSKIVKKAPPDSPGKPVASQNNIEEGKSDPARVSQKKPSTQEPLILRELWSKNPEIIPQIFHRLIDILKLRLVTKELYRFVTSTTISGDHTLLSSRAFISFNYDEIHPVVEKSIRENFDFAKANTQVDVKISLDRLFKSKPILPSVPHNRLNFIIKIDSRKALEDFLKLLSEDKNNTRINQIIGLDLEKIQVDQFSLPIINQLLNIEFISKLKKLSLGKLYNISLTLPSFPELSLLTFGSCIGQVSINALGSFPALSTLSFGEILCGSFALNLPDELPSLKILSFEDSSAVNSTIKLPNFLPQLRACSFKNIWIIKLVFPNELPELETLIFKNISIAEPLNLPLLPRLRILSFGILGFSIYNFPKTLPMLTELSFGKINSSATLNLPTSLDNLKNLTDESGIVRRHLEKIAQSQPDQDQSKT